MTTIQELSAGVIPYHKEGDRGLRYLVLHSATVRNPRAKWEFPKGGVEPGETTHQTASREFQEETGLQDWSFVEGFERSLSYTYIRRGRKVVKTVTYYLVEVLVGPAATFDVPAPATGRLAEIRGEEDDQVRPGAVLGLVAAAEDGDADEASSGRR